MYSFIHYAHYAHKHTCSDVGPYNGVHYRCKWHCPLDKLSVMEPDYMNDIWDHVVKQGEGIINLACTGRVTVLIV